MSKNACNKAFFPTGETMQTDVRKIYEINKKLVGAVDRAVCLFRIGRYDKA